MQTTLLGVVKVLLVETYLAEIFETLGNRGVELAESGLEDFESTPKKQVGLGEFALLGEQNDELLEHVLHVGVVGAAACAFEAAHAGA